MPGDKPSKARPPSAGGSRGGICFSAILGLAIAGAGPVPAFADLHDPAGSWLSFGDVVMLAVFGGAMSFAILAASWLIRERGRMSAEANDLRRRLSEMRAVQERSEALINVADQRIVVWSGADASPQVLGRLSPRSGAPEGRAEFLAFGRWLDPDSAISFESALLRLRRSAEAFDLPLMVRGGAVIETQGRTSGGYAFVRFVELGGERMALSRLEAEHVRLNSLFDAVRALFERLPVPVWLRDGLGNLLWANDAYAWAVERNDGEAVVRDGVELLDSPQRRNVEKALAEGGVFRGALPAVVGGDRRVLDITEVRAGGAYAGIAIDRSEIEAAQAALSETVAGHRQTLDQLQTPIAMFDSSQRMQFHNRAFVSLFGLQESFLESMPTNAELFDALRAARKLPERPDWRKWRNAQLEIYRSVEPREEVWHLGDGQTLRVFANPHSPGGATWVFQDVTEHLELQSNFNALQHIQGETLDHLREAVAVFGPDGRLRLFNPAFATLWNMAETVQAGLHVSKFAAAAAMIGQGEDWQAIADRVTGFDESRDTMTGRIELDSGAILDYALVPLPAAQSLLTITDVTATVKFERTLRERNEALEQSDLLKTRFIQNVSYELRAPLTSIAGFTELLAMQNIGKLNAKQEEYVGHVGQAADVLKALIDDILDLASIDAGVIELDRRQTRLRPIVDACVVEIEARLRARQVRVEIALDPRAGAVLADAGRLRQIVFNVLANCAAMSPDGGAIQVASRHGGEGVELIFSDEGPMIEPADRERIFGRFERRSGDRNRRGSDLGLSIAKRLVELHGGTLRVDAERRSGAGFILFLPGPAEKTKAA